MSESESDNAQKLLNALIRKVAALCFVGGLVQRRDAHPDERGRTI